MSFKQGFMKTAGLTAGLANAGRQTIADTMKLKGMRDAFSGIRKNYKGKMSSLIKTHEGRRDLAQAVGESLPSAVVGALYAKGAKKAITTLAPKQDNQYDQAYYS